MVKRLSHAGAQCPVARALDVIGDWWSLLVIRDAFDGVRRFSDFQNGLGISKGTLTTRLKDLTERGILELAPASDGSAYSEYILSEKGKGLYLVIAALRQWGEDHFYEQGDERSALVDVETERAVAKLELRSQDGRILSWSDTRVMKVDETRKHAMP